MRAEHLGPCVACPEPIKPGDRIMRQDGGWAHTACPKAHLGPICPKCFLTRPCGCDDE